MAEPITPFDEAEDYLLGRLKTGARQRFEARLAEDAALRRHVRELEAGLVAVAMSTPQLRPPPETWSNIHRAVAGKTEKLPAISVLRLRWLLGGWAVAGGLMLVLLFRPGFNHPAPTVKNSGGGMQNSATMAIPEENSASGNQNSPAPDQPSNTIRSLAGKPDLFINSTGGPEPASSPQPGQVAVMAPAVSALSDGHHESPGMQKAMVLAMARQVGLSNAPVAIMRSGKEVRFVQLDSSHPGTDIPAWMLAAGIDADTMAPLDLLPAEPGASGAIHFFASDDNLMVAVDPSLLPANARQLTVWQVDTDGNQSIIGIVDLNDQPTVITISNANLADNPEYYVTVGGNILGHFPRETTE